MRGDNCVNSSSFITAIHKPAQLRAAVDYADNFSARMKLPRPLQHLYYQRPHHRTPPSLNYNGARINWNTRLPR